MRLLKLLAIYLTVTVVLTPGGVAETSGGVVLNGELIPYSSASVDATIEVSEFRDGNDPLVVRLVPGTKRYGVCIVARGPVALLDAELPIPDSPDRFSVRIEDRREFGSCLLESLKLQRGPFSTSRPGYEYCLRCESLALPTP